MVALTYIEPSNIQKGINDFPTQQDKCEREDITEIPDIWTTFSHSLTQKKSESFSPEETKQQVEEFICIESDKEEDAETWATVSLSSSTQTYSEESRPGNFLLELETGHKFFA